MEELSTVQKIAVMALPMVFAIVFHEVAHGWVANRLGDHTARDMGRLTINPLPHIDIVGTVILPVLCIIAGSPIFGYAKPVPINPYNFRNPKKDMALSSIAGPAVNFIMAILATVLLRLVIAPLEGKVPEPYWSWLATPLAYMLIYAIYINVILGVLNLIPIPPLDGSRIVYWLLPDKLAAAYYQVERFGIILLMILMFSGIFGKIMMPLIRPLLSLMLGDGVL
ncbi:MAG: site-2 protease family protein [Nitrospiraceae bacterium]|nr:site-2 protease family protein [Nitrospiraceae bacterium]